MQVNIWSRSSQFGSNRTSTFQMRSFHFHIFSLSYNLTSDDLWPWYMTFDCTIIWRFPYYINKPGLVPIGLLQLFKKVIFTFLACWPQMTFDLYIWPLTTWTYEGSHISTNQQTFDLDIWPLTSSTNEGSHVAPMTQLWLKAIKACGR